MDGPELVFVFLWPSWAALVALLLNKHSGFQRDQKGLREGMWTNSAASFKVIYSVTQCLAKAGIMNERNVSKPNAKVWWKGKKKRKDFALQIKDKSN